MDRREGFKQHTNQLHVFTSWRPLNNLHIFESDGQSDLGGRRTDFSPNAILE